MNSHLLFFLHKFIMIYMKNNLYYYYGLNFDEIIKKDNYYALKKNKDIYLLYENQENSTDLIKKYYIIKNIIDCHEIIYNKYNSYITFFEEKNYILMKVLNNETIIFSFENLMCINLRLGYQRKLDWISLWTNKIDYYEQQMIEFGMKYPILNESFNYYIGLSELAISLLNYVKKVEFTIYLCHKRIESNLNNLSLLNPLNIVFDNITRDIAAYIKVNFFYNDLSIMSAINLLNSISITPEEAILLFSRLLYPSYFFDLYDKILNEDNINYKLDYIVKKNVCYETFLLNIYNFFRNKYNIPKIEWFEKISLHK